MLLKVNASACIFQAKSSISKELTAGDMYLSDDLTVHITCLTELWRQNKDDFAFCLVTCTFMLEVGYKNR